MEHYYYLLIDFFTLLFPFLYSFDKRVKFYRSWPKLFPALLIGGSLFLVWDYFFTINGVWSFNERYISGIKLWELPIEEILFFIVVPYSCLFIYACVKYYQPKIIEKRFAKWVWLGLIIFSIFFIVLYYDRIYTLITFSLLLILVSYFYWKPKVWHSTFLIAYLFSLIPFFIVNGLLTSLPVVLYDNAENIDFRWITIPFEDSFYMLALLMLDTWLLEGNN